jgi:hypothetical protein
MVRVVVFGVLGLLAAVGFAFDPGLMPDGSLVFSGLRTPFGRLVERAVGHPYTHVGIVLDGRVYEATLPRVKSSPAAAPGLRGGFYHWYSPNVRFSVGESAGVRSFVSSQVGRPYGLRTWVNPRVSSQRGIYCSELAGQALTASGRYRLPRAAGYDPAALLRAVGSDYRFRGVTRW